MRDPDVEALGPEFTAARARLEEVDAELLRLIDERTALAREPGQTVFDPAGEAIALRTLLAQPRETASAELVVRLWRELNGEALQAEAGLTLTVWGARVPARVAEMARLRFGGAPPLALVERPEAAVAAARRRGGIGVLALDPIHFWWGRLLAEPRLKVFAALPEFAGSTAVAALCVAEVEVGPTGGDQTFWVTDHEGSAAAVERALGGAGLAAERIAEAGGLKLFALAGYLQPEDERLARAPGRLSGVIGAAPRLDL